MVGRHLAPRELEAYAEGEYEDTARAATEQHLADCAACRTRAHRVERFETALRGLPRESAPRDLAERILAAVDWRAAQEQARRKRAPFIAVATFSSLWLALWLASQMVAAFQENGALDFFSVFAQRPDIFSNYSSDAFFALVETLPISEILLTLFAFLTMIVLTQQLVEAVQPRVASVK